LEDEVISLRPGLIIGVTRAIERIKLATAGPCDPHPHHALFIPVEMQADEATLEIDLKILPLELQ
jgi:hypothetical protein